MGMFGSSAPSAGLYSASALSPQDRLMMAGAMMKDVGASLRGGEGGSVPAMMGMITQRQMIGNLLGAMNGDDGSSSGPGGAAGAPGGAAPAGGGVPRLSPRVLTALSFAFPEAAKALIEQQKLNHVAIAPNGQAYGEYDTGIIGQNFAPNQVVNGFNVNLQKPGAPSYIPTAPVDGAVPVQTPNGMDWAVPKGAAAAIDLKNRAAIMRGEAALAEVPIAAANSRTQAAAQQNTASQNVVAPPPGFIVRPRKR